MRILIVAETALAAEAIRGALRYAPACEVLGYIDARNACGTAVAAAQPDVVIVDDTRNPDLMLARIHDVRRLLPEAKIVLLAADMGVSRLDRAFGAGIHAVIAKTAQAASVGMLVREVAAGNVYHAYAASPAPSISDQSAAAMLTAREREILQLVAAGLSNNRIARQLWITEQTVKFHLSNIYRKLNLTNRTEASHYAHTHGLVGLGPHAEPAPVPDAA